MFRKIFIGSAILATSVNVTLASPAPYIGASLGIINNTSGWSNFRGVPFNLFVGYGGIINQNFYLGGELNLLPGTGEISNHGFVRSTYAYGFSLLPGFMLSDHTLAFLRLGITGTRFANNKNCWICMNNNGNTEVGGTIGLGLQTSVTQNVDLRGEYAYTAFQHAIHSDAFNLGVIYKFD